MRSVGWPEYVPVQSITEKRVCDSSTTKHGAVSVVDTREYMISRRRRLHVLNPVTRKPGARNMRLILMSLC